MSMDYDISNSKIIGVIERVDGKIKVISADGSVKLAQAGEILLEGETLVSASTNAYISVNYVALSAIVEYEGKFDIELTKSVAEVVDTTETVIADDVWDAISDLDTAQGSASQDNPTLILPNGIFDIPSIAETDDAPEVEPEIYSEYGQNVLEVYNAVS